MNYSELTRNVQDICENTFEAEQLAMFTQQAEQKVYNSVEIPALRKNSLGALTVGNNYLTVPPDFLYVYSLAAIKANGAYEFMLDKDVNFIREAYPTPTAVGLPKHYAIFSDTSLLIGPSPDAGYAVELHYGYYPESIVTAGNTWLGDNFDSVLLNGALVEAIRFMKGEEDLVVLYEKHYMMSLALLVSLGQGKLRQDAYRAGRPRIPVK